MKMPKRLLCFVLAALLSVLLAIPASASSSKDLGTFWIENGVLYQYFGKDTDVVIPSNVTEIRHDAFQNCSFIRSITIPDSVTKIDSNAFYKCSATTIVIPESVTFIGAGAFSSSGLTSVTLPSHLTEISEGLFSFCDGLKDIKIPASVKSIGDSAFASCDLRSVIIPNGVQSIGKGAFQSNYHLKSVVIPDSVTYIGASEGPVSHALENEDTGNDTNGAFYDCSNLTIYGSINSCAYQYAQAHSIPFIDLSAAVSSPESATAAPLSASVLVNNELVSFDAYVIDGHTYMKLRDVAKAVNKTQRNFNVIWNSKENAIDIATATEYAPIGGEMAPLATPASVTAVKCYSDIYVDGRKTRINTYAINGFAYMSLRDIGAAVGIAVIYDSTIKSICIYSQETSLYDSVVGTWKEIDGYYDWTISFAYGGKTIWPWGNGTYSISFGKLYLDFGDFSFYCTYEIKNDDGRLVLSLTDSSGTLRFARTVG